MNFSTSCLEWPSSFYSLGNSYSFRLLHPMKIRVLFVFTEHNRIFNSCGNPSGDLHRDLQHIGDAPLILYKPMSFTISKLKVPWVWSRRKLGSPNLSAVSLLYLLLHACTFIFSITFIFPPCTNFKLLFY